MFLKSLYSLTHRGDIEIDPRNDARTGEDLSSDVFAEAE